MIDDTQESLFDLVDTLLRHGTIVEDNVGQGVGTSRANTFGARPSPTKDPDRSPYSTRSRNCSGHAEGS